MAPFIFQLCHNNVNHFFRSKFTNSIKLIHTETLVSHLKNCSTFPGLQSLQALMIKSDAITDCYFMNQFISACSSLNQIDYAKLALTHMEFPNIFVYNSLIRGFVDWGRQLQALNMYIQMLRNHIRPTSFTLPPLIKCCSQLFDFQFGEGIHCHVWKMGLDDQVFVLTALVDFYGKMGMTVEARKVFDEMPERDSFAWSTMVSVHARDGDMPAARSLFDEMPVKRPAAWNAVIDGYAKLGNVDAAELLFDQMEGKNVVSWTTMIACYTQNKEYNKALATFDEMILRGFHPEKRTLTLVVSCCAHLGALDLGKKVHLYVFQEGLSLDVYVGSALVDMYAKCGKLDRAIVMFLNLKEKNLFCWNSIIEGLAAHGHGKSAIAMFHKMLQDNVKPNGVTFISVLSACAHAGLVGEGREIFESMVSRFQIHPEIKHYGCMVDLLCKAKLLEDALEFIRCMNIEPNSVVWGALLSGCKLCKNIEIAEIAVSKLMELEPDNCGYHSLLISMYAEANRWKEVREIRTTMRELGIEKGCPASSWIEMENELHQFVSADCSHPAFNEICALLDELYEQLKPAYLSI